MLRLAGRGPDREVLQRLGANAYVQSSTLFLYPSWWISRNNERLRQTEAQDLAAFAPVEVVASRIDAMLALRPEEACPYHPTLTSRACRRDHA